MKKTITKLILVIFLCISSFYFGVTYDAKNTNKVDTSSIDSVVYVIDTVYAGAKDSIKKIEDKKTQVDGVYVEKIKNLDSLKLDTSSLKKTFDSIFTKTEPDSFTTVGYSQIYGALVINSKYMRDSTKLLLTDTQLKICTIGLDSMYSLSHELSDTAKKVAIREYIKGYKQSTEDHTKIMLSSATATFALGILLGVFLVR